MWKVFTSRLAHFAKEVDDGSSPFVARNRPAKSPYLSEAGVWKLEALLIMHHFIGKVCLLSEDRENIHQSVVDHGDGRMPSPIQS